MSRFCLAMSLALLAITVEAQPAAKFTAVLADLVSSGSFTTLTSDRMPMSVRDAVRSRRLRIDSNNEVQVYILMAAVTDDTVRQLADAGVTIEIRDPARRRVQARLPVSRLQSVAALAIVDAIRLPTYARRRAGKATTEGDAIVYADAVRLQLALDGTAVRVGVVSDGLKGVFATGCTSCAGADGGPIATGDLPGATGVRNANGVLTSASGGIIGRSFQANGDLEGLPPAAAACAFQGAGAEGTALLEIVHDIAPGAKLSFANADTDLAFMQAVNFLAASNDIVLDDVGFYGEPSDGTSAVSNNTAAALNNPTWPIRAYFTAVGNDADQHYYGAYQDSKVDGTTVAGIATPGHLHLFQRTTDTTDVLGLGPQPYNVISLPQNGAVAIFLTWDDPFGASANNYDLFLVQESSGRVVASSTDVQAGRQDPSEALDYVNRGSPDRFSIVVQNVRDAAQPRHLNIFSFQPQCASAGPERLAPPRHERHNYNTAARSVSAQGDAGGSPVSVISVGAVCSASAAAAAVTAGPAPNESCLDTNRTTPEPFSSRGPTLDGRTKPDVAAIDGVSVTGAGGFGTQFFGTSAATPHLGGVAALLLQNAPCLLSRATSTIAAATARATLRDLLLTNAARVDTPNHALGAGRVDAFASVRATLPAWKGTSATFIFDGNTASGAAITPEQLGFVDPNQCALTTLNWTGGCGTAPGSTMTCPAGTSTVFVSASSNGFGYSDPVELQIVVTDYAVNVTPATAALAPGGSSQHIVEVTPQGGAYDSEVTLACASANLPPQTTCTFDPPNLVPGASGARSILTLATASSSSVAAASRVRPSAPIGTRAVGSGIALFPASLTFGSQILSTTAPAQFVYATNIGTDTGDFAGVNNCGTSLAVGASCTVAVTFTPTVAGSRTGTLSFVDDASGSPHTVALAGSGQAAPDASAGTPAGNYTVTISGTAGTLSHFGGVILTVQ
jgi:hypothetical protein